MNKREAIRWMLRGARLTHRHSSPDEWVTIGEDGLIELEDGVRCTPAESWSCRSGECLETGWDFVSPPDVCTCIAARESDCAVGDASPLERACMKGRYFVFMYNSKR